MSTPAEIRTKAAQIRLVIFDVDGVLTDGSLFLGDDGLEYKAFHAHDGYGMKLLQHGGVEIAVITARTSQVVSLRMQSLGVQRVYQGRLEKLAAYHELLAETGYTDAQIAYVGDDLVDLPVMMRVGLAMAVADAHPVVQRYAHGVTQRAGGRGAAREVCELILDAQDKLAPLLAHYLSGQVVQ
jgi:3-deoxy-D-manno-octulosonate 8-phosphate phosphatase (KDO 8-P phosphatase)